MTASLIACICTLVGFGGGLLIGICAGIDWQRREK